MSDRGDNMIEKENQVYTAIRNWLDSRGVSYKFDVDFIEFPRPNLLPEDFRKLVKEAEEKFEELGYTNYDVFETTIVVNFPERKRTVESE